MAKPSLSMIVPAVALVAAASAEAHLLGREGATLSSGIVHPFLGLDHLLTAMAVGMWAARFEDRRAWYVPLAFVAVMLCGALLAGTGMVLPRVEGGVLISILALGLLIGLGLQPPVSVSLWLIATFAFCHGQAHGSEWPQAAPMMFHGLGLVLGTAGLHALGILAGRLLDKRHVWTWRTIGLLLAVSGGTMPGLQS